MRQVCLGAYGDQFGSPELEVVVDGQGLISSVVVHRGAPCDATWRAVAKVIGVAAVDAPRLYGLEAQLLCKAKSALWDPVARARRGSPIHFAGKVHRGAIAQAIQAESAE